MDFAKLIEDFQARARAASVESLAGAVLVFHLENDDGTARVPFRHPLAPEIRVASSDQQQSNAIAAFILLDSVLKNISSALGDWKAPEGNQPPRFAWSEWPDEDRLAGIGPTARDARLVDITLELG